MIQSLCEKKRKERCPPSEIKEVQVLLLLVGSILLLLLLLLLLPLPRMNKEVFSGRRHNNKYVSAGLEGVLSYLIHIQFFSQNQLLLSSISKSNNYKKIDTRIRNWKTKTKQRRRWWWWWWQRRRRWTIDTVIRNTATPDWDVNSKYVYVYVSMGAMLYSIHIQFFLQTQPFLFHIQNQITIKRLTEEYEKGNQSWQVVGGGELPQLW